MNTMRRMISLCAIALGAVFAMTAATSMASAYPAGHKAHIELSASRVHSGTPVTITGKNYPQRRVVIKVVCRGHSPTKRFTERTSTTVNPDGTFTYNLDTSNLPRGRCIVTAYHGSHPINSDRATFFVNPNGSTTFAHSSRLTNAASITGGLTGSSQAGSGSALVVYLVGGFGVLFLAGGGALMIAGRRRHAVVG